MSQAKVDKYKKEKANRKKRWQSRKRKNHWYHLWMCNFSCHRWMGRLYRIQLL